MRKTFNPVRIVIPAGGLTRRDSAAYLGCSTRYLDKLAAAGELRRVKLGAKTIFLRSELDRFLLSKMQRSEQAQ